MRSSSTWRSSAASTKAVTVKYATGNNSAGEGDYGVTSGTVTFAPGQHGLQPLGSFGVPRTGEVLEIRGVGTEQHGHVCDATVQCE